MPHPIRCTVEAYPEIKFIPVGMTDFERAQPHLEITFKYLPGRPAYTPRGEYAPIDPPDSPEVDFISAKLMDGDGLDPTQGQVDDWARDWLDSDAGYNVACQAGEDEPNGPDPDEWLDRKRDDADRF